MGSGKKIKERYKYKESTSKNPYFLKADERPIKILLAHDNRLDYHTDKAHRFAEWMDKKNEFKVIYDKQMWKRGEKTSKTETDRRERRMVKKTDIVVRLVHPPSKSGEKRHEGAKREFRKAMNAQKPIIEIYYQGARTSPNRSVQEKNYKYRIPVHIKRGERLETAINRGLNELSETDCKL